MSANQSTDVSEVWKPVVGFEGLYEVSDCGRVRSCGWVIPHVRGGFIRRPGVVLSPCLIKKGYLRVFLKKQGKGRLWLVHRLVAAAFIPNEGCRDQVNHLNGIKTDNRVANLAWVSQGENMTHAYQTGLKMPVRGSKQWGAKLTESDIPVIRARIARGDSNKEIAADFGVGATAIGNIRTGYSWGHL